MSSYSNISDILLELNNNKDAANGTAQKSALALSNTSELEIKNLLKQIDSMIHHKKLRWERQKQELDNKLQLKEQELVTLKSSIEQKNNQIEQFKKVLNNMEKTSQDVMNKYENEIHVLHDQLSKVKNDFVKMQRKYKQKYQEGAPQQSVKPLSQISINTSSTSSSSASSLSLSSSPSVKRPSSFAISSSTLNSALKNRIQPPLFAPVSPKVDQSNRFGTKNQDEDEMNNYKHSSVAKKLKSNLINDNENSNPLETEIERLKKQLDEYRLKEVLFTKEKDKLNKLNQHYKNQNQELIKKIDEITKMNGDKHTKREEQSEQENEAAQTDKLNLEFYKQELRKRDEYIKNVEALEKAGHIELQFYKDEVKKYKKQEASVKSDLENLKKDYHDAIKRLELIENENKRIKQKSISNEERIKNDQLMKKRYEEDKERHLREVANLRNEIQAFTHQLADKNNQIKLLQEQSNCLDKLLREKEDQYAKVNQELIMTVAHVEALKLENHFLKQSLVEKKSDEKEVLEMQKKYHQLVDMTEKENKRLKNEVVALTECIESLKANSSSNVNKKCMDLDSRRLNNLRLDYEKQIESLKKQHEMSVKRMNSEIEKLYSEKDALLAEMENKKFYQYQDDVVLHNFDDKNERNLENNYGYNHESFKKKHNITSSSNPELLAKTNSLSEGALSLSHQSLQSDHGYRPEINRFRSKVEDSLTIKYNKSKNDLESSSDIENRRRLSISSEAKLQEEIRKQKFESILNNHIDNLRASNSNEKLIIKNNNNNIV